MNERPVKCRAEAGRDLPSRHAVLRRRIPRAAATSSSAITLASRASISRSVYRESSRTARTKPGGSASPVALSCSTLWRESLSLSSVRVGAASTCWAVGGGCGTAIQPVAEYQARGVVHYHAIIRLDAPGPDHQPPPARYTAALWRAAIPSAPAAVSVGTAA